MNIFLNKWLSDIYFISSGLIINIQLTILAVFFGILIAITLAIAKVSRYNTLRLFAAFYTSIFRGTPLIIQLSLIYYVLPSVLGLRINTFTASIISLSLNSGAYVSEIFRSGINSISKGQMEVCTTLGISRYYAYRDIILPQALRQIFPSLVNEVINMLKETSVISIIGEVEILRRAQLVAGQRYDYFVPLITCALSYYIVVLVLVWMASYLEKRLSLNSQ